MTKKTWLTLVLCGALSCALVLTSAVKNAEAQKPIPLRIAHVEAEDRSTHKALLKFKEYVEKESNGRMVVEIFPNGVFGGDLACVQGLETGTIEMTLPATSFLTSYNDKFGLLDMPFMFKSEEAVFNAMDGELGAAYTKILDDLGLHPLGYNYNGSRCMSNNTRPINEPADMKGMKIRVMESPVYIDMMKALGANPTPMSFGEVFTALQQGTVTGQENAPSLTYAMRYYEVQKYYSLTYHTFSIMPILISKEYFDGLPADLREIVQKGSDEWLIKFQRKLESDETLDYVKRLEEKGMIINEITPENHAKFVEAVKPVYDKNIPKIGQDLFDIAAKYNQ